jgi:hypothetical protein
MKFDIDRIKQRIIDRNPKPSGGPTADATQAIAFLCASENIPNIKRYTEWEILRNEVYRNGGMLPTDPFFDMELLRNSEDKTTGLAVQFRPNSWGPIPALIADAVHSLVLEDMANEPEQAAEPKPDITIPKFILPNRVVALDGKEYILRGQQQINVFRILYKGKGNKIMTRDLMPSRKNDDPPRVDKVIKRIPKPVQDLIKNDNDREGYYIPSLR